MTLYLWRCRVSITARVGRVDLHGLVAEPGHDVNDRPGPDDDRGIAGVGAHQDVGVVVHVQVQST